jgi:hypothetical protein
MKYLSPIDGDMLHAGDGALEEDTLHIPVKILATADRVLSVNGRQAVHTGDYFLAEIPLSDYKNTIETIDKTTGERLSITVYRLKNFAGKYRLSIDDNIWFLRDLHDNANTYKSLFDNPFLSFLKEVNTQYGTKIHLNLFYQTDGVFQKDDFNLSRLDEKFKGEWAENADWLTLSFHARGEFPDQPYMNADYNQVKTDCDQVHAEIRRFAGKEVMTDVTAIHWFEATPAASRALRDAGYRGLLGFFNVDDDEYPGSYYLSEDQRRNIKKRFVWKDESEGTIFIKTSIVIDTKKLDEIVPHLESYIEKPPYLDLLVHEQYFYPFYFNYQPDYRDKILTAIKWAHENGYQPAKLGECI